MMSRDVACWLSAQNALPFSPGPFRLPLPPPPSSHRPPDFGAAVPDSPAPIAPLAAPAAPAFPPVPIANIPAPAPAAAPFVVCAVADMGSRGPDNNRCTGLFFLEPAHRVALTPGGVRLVTWTTLAVIKWRLRPYALLALSLPGGVGLVTWTAVSIGVLTAK
jgi:hypothetical protein